MIDEAHAILGELAVLAAQVERDERRILVVARERLEIASDAKERRKLDEIVERASALLCGKPAKKRNFRPTDLA